MHSEAGQKVSLWRATEPVHVISCALYRSRYARLFQDTAPDCSAGQAVGVPRPSREMLRWPFVLGFGCAIRRCHLFGRGVIPIPSRKPCPLLSGLPPRFSRPISPRCRLLMPQGRLRRVSDRATYLRLEAPFAGDFAGMWSSYFGVF